MDPLHQAFPAAPVSDALRNRVAILVVSPPPQRLPWRSLALGVSGCAAVAAVAFVALPRPATASGFLQKIANGPIPHVRTYRIEPDGRRILVREHWSTPEGRRFESRSPIGPMLAIENAARSFIVEWWPDTGYLGIRNLASPSGAAPSTPAVVDPQSLSQLVRLWDVKSEPVFEDATFEGKPAKRVKLRHVTFYAEPDTLRLMGTRVDSKPPTILIADEEPPPAHAFDPVIEYAGRRIDVLKERERIAGTLKTPVATLGTASGRIDIRRVEMNRRGDLFVLYTGPGKGPTAVTDDTGAAYVPGKHFPPSQDFLALDWPGYSFGNQPLRGAWFVRMGSPKLPKNLRIAFEKAIHAQPIQPASTELLDFMPFTQMGLGSTASLAKFRSLSLASHYEKLGRWVDTEREARRYLALLTPFDRALDARYLLAKSLAKQGRKLEARREIQAARKLLNPSNTTMKGQLDQLERSL